MAVNNDVIIRMRLAGEEFDREFKVKLQDVTAAAEKQSEEAGKKAGSKFGAGFAAAAGLAGAAIGAAINSAGNLGAEIASTSKQFNIGVENLQIWRQAAANAGVSADNLSDGLGALTEKIGQANAGNRQAQQGFVDLGLSFKTVSGQARATDEVMLDLARKIAEIKDPSERVSRGMQLLGEDFKTLYPLLLDGAEGFNQARQELGAFGAILTQEEIRNLEKTNTKIEQMKNVLAIRVAGVVAENADAIITLTNKLSDLAIAAVEAANAWLGMQSAFGSDFNRAVAAIPSNLPQVEKERRVQKIAALTYRGPGGELVAGTGDGIFDLRDPSKRKAPPSGVEYYTPYSRDRIRDMLYAPPPQALAAPTLSGGGGSRRTSGGGGARRPEKSDEEKAYEAARKAEDQLRASVEKTAQAQRDSAEIARIRVTQGELAAAVAKAELDFARQGPAFQAKTVEELGKALGYGEKLAEVDRQRLQTILAILQANRENAKSDAGLKVTGDTLAEAARRYNAAQAEMEKANQAAAEDFRRRYETALGDVAGIYESLFRGGTKDLWRNFKDEGTRIIAEIAAQWTLSLISGQPFNFNQAASGAFGRSPLSSLFFGTGGGAANDNGFGGGFGGIFGGIGGSGGGYGTPGYGAGLPGYIPPSGGGLAGAAARVTLGRSPFAAVGGGIASILPQAFAISQLSNLVGGGIADLVGLPYSKTGGSLFGALGGIIGGLLKGTPRGSVTVGNLGGTLGITGSQGNSKARKATATEGAGSLIDAIFQIAEQLGGSVDPTRGAVSFGMRKNSFRVDPTGRGATKIGNGAVDFGADQEAAMRFAIGDLIKDGVITGISQASQNLLQKGGDLDKQVEKALLIEQIPKLLKERLDPLGAALDELDAKWRKVNDALKEGSASAEQIAQARQLWELEKADAIASVGAASQSLKDFLAALNAGSSSPLSLREQRAEAERQLQPFLAQISAAETARAEVERLRASGASAEQIKAAEDAARTAAAAINQDGFTNASQLLLSISRQANASGAGYFADFDRVRALTGQAIGFVDQASARGGDTRDPFAQETAQNTKDSALILSDLAAESRAQGETLRQIAAALSGGGDYTFIGETRAFAR